MMSDSSAAWIVMITSWMCPSSFVPGPPRCARSPRPVNVGVCTACPAACSSGATRFQHQPPCHAPWTSTYVFVVMAVSLRSLRSAWELAGHLADRRRRRVLVRLQPAEDLGGGLVKAFRQAGGGEAGGDLLHLADPAPRLPCAAGRRD